MRILRLNELTGDDCVYSDAVPGARIGRGGMSFYGPGERSHPEGYHVHDEVEFMAIMQGAGDVEIDGKPVPVRAGDVVVIEPGEDHHLIGGEESVVMVWARPPR